MKQKLNSTIKNIVFDFGGVVMDWDPRYLYKDYFNDDEKMEWFLSNITTNEWNAEQDRGRPLQEATDWLITQYPDWEKEIKLFYGSWTTMLKGEIPQHVTVLRALANTSYELYGLTNWSQETIHHAYDNYDFFKLFEGKIVVSGDEKLIKPDPAIWKVLLNRYDLKAEESVFIDDNIKNIEVAHSLGFKTVHLLEDTDLRTELEKLGIQF